MCKLPKVVVLAPAQRHLELRKELSSLEYDIVATISNADELGTIGADVVVAVDPDAETVQRLRTLGVKVAAVGGAGEEADLALSPDELRTFKTRIWELFRVGGPGG